MSRLRIEKVSSTAEKAASAVILLLLFAFVLYLGFSAVTESSFLSTDDPSGEKIIFLDDNIFLNSFVLTILLAASYLFFRHCESIHPRRMEAALLAWVFVAGSAFIASAKLRSPVYSDSFLVTYGAQRASLGDYSVLTENYFYRFPFQLGYVLYAELFFRVVGLVLRHAPEGYAVLALQEMNLLWLMLQYHALIEITGLLFKDARIRKLLMLLLFLCLPPLLTVTFLYGNIPAFSCGTVAVWMFLGLIKKGEAHWGILCALFLALAVTLKLNLLILCVAVGGVWLIMLLKKPSRRSLLCLLLAAACVLSIPKLPQKFYEMRLHVHYGEGIPMVAWMAMGFDQGHAAPGWYKEDHTVTAFERSGHDSEATAENAKQVLKERIAVFRDNPKMALRFFSEKYKSQWNEPSFGSLWINQVFPSFSEKGRLYNLICGRGGKQTLIVMDQLQQMVLFGLLAGIIRLRIKKDLLRCLLPLILLGGISYHLLFEAKSQYAMPYIVLVLPIAAYGLYTFFRKLEG